jgi:hypothetical protein
LFFSQSNSLLLDTVRDLYFFQILFLWFIFEVAGPAMSEALETDTDKINALRDAIMVGLVKETDDCLRGVDVVFPVEDNAKDIFVRDFYGTFWKCFLESVVPDSTCPGMICRGPPGVGKVY